jgi:hypothetical protein
VSKVYVSGTESRILLIKQCAELIGSLFIHKVFDDRYYLPPLADAIRIMEEAKVSACEYSAEFDCDDFHRTLVAAFLNDAYRVTEGKRRRRPPYLFGIAESYDHAFNVMVNDDKLVRFIEPQTSDLYLPHELPTGIVEVDW